MDDTRDDAGSVFTAPKPCLSHDELSRIGGEIFGVEGAITPLASERDQNVRVDAVGGSFVVKVANAAEQRSALELQQAALAHLAAVDPGLAVPRVVPPGVATARAADGTEHFVRCVTHLPGAPYATAAHTPQLRHELGRFMGRLSAGMQGFGHAAAHQPDFLWNLDRAADVAALASAIADPDDRSVAERAFRRHAQRVMPLLPHLRGAVVHHDANDHNVLVEGGMVSGLIDFGDMLFARQVNELAVTLAYALIDVADVVAAGRDVISGYTAEFSLSADELRVVYDLAATRLAMSVAISSHRSRQFGDNEYLLVSQAPALRLLRRLMTMRPDFLHFAAREAAGLTPVPRHDGIVGWMASPACQPQPVLPLDLRRAGRILVSLADGAPATQFTDPEASWEWMRAQMTAARATIAVGGYDEDRSCYAGEQFRTDAPEARSVHLGIDLFIDTDTTVHAMLPGTVETVVDNAAPYDYGPTVILRHEAGDHGPFWCLYGHLSRRTLSTVRPGQYVEAGEIVGYIGDHTVNGGWAPHVHVQLITDLMADPLIGPDGNFEGAGEPSRMSIWRSIAPNANLLIGLAPETFTPSEPDSPESLITRRVTDLGPSLSTSYRRKLSIVRGEGAWLYDHTGRGYLDCVNNVCHVGHGHPHVVEAIARQAALLNTNTRYLHRTILDYAERLAATFPDPLSVVYFVNSGSEANELALRLARAATGRHDIVAIDWGYHGNTSALVDISAYKFNRPGGSGKPAHVHIAELPDPYRGRFAGYGTDAGEAYARSVADACALAAAGAAAFIAESVSGCGGQIVYPDGYLVAAYAHARAAGAVCIADEVQVGFGRAGSAMWAFDAQGAVPDIVSLGKPIGNGHPLGAVVTTPTIAAAFANGMEFFSTFGGNPVSCAAGMAVLDVIEREQLQDRARDTGEYLVQRLRAMQARHRLIGNVRGLGMYIGVDLVTDRVTREPATAATAAVLEAMRDRGVLLSSDGPYDNVLKIKPPLVFGRAEADILCDELDQVLSIIR